MHTFTVYYRARDQRGQLGRAKLLGDHQFPEVPFKGAHLALPGSLCGSKKLMTWVEVVEVVIPLKGVRPYPAVLVYDRPGSELNLILQGADDGL